MAALSDEGNEIWLAVIGRSLAFLCLQAADLRGKDVGDQASLLNSLGLGNDEIATMIGSTPNSVRVLLQNRRKAKGGGRGSKASKGKGR